MALACRVLDSQLAEKSKHEVAVVDGRHAGRFGQWVNLPAVRI